MYIHTQTIYIYIDIDIYARRLAFPLPIRNEMTKMTLLPTGNMIKCIKYFLYPMQNGIYTVNTRAANNAKVTKLGRKTRWIWIPINNNWKAQERIQSILRPGCFRINPFLLLFSCSRWSSSRMENKWRKSRKEICKFPNGL